MIKRPKDKIMIKSRGGEGAGCQRLSGAGCRNCGFCKSGEDFSVTFSEAFFNIVLSGDLRSQNRCPAKQCTNRIPIQPRGSTGSPVKDGSGGGEIKKKKGRCGECEGCKVGDFNVGEILFFEAKVKTLLFCQANVFLQGGRLREL